MPTTSTRMSEERVAALLALFGTLPEPMRHALEASAKVMSEHEARHAKIVARAEENNAELAAANATLEDVNAQLLRKKKAMGAENGLLRDEVASLRAENAALSDERRAFELLEGTFGQYSLKKRMADAAAAPISKQEIADDAVQPVPGQADRMIAAGDFASHYDPARVALAEGVQARLETAVAPGPGSCPAGEAHAKIGVRDGRARS